MIHGDLYFDGVHENECGSFGVIMSTDIDGNLADVYGETPEEAEANARALIALATVLTEQEKEFLTLAIQGLCMRQGPITFGLATELAKKLDIENHLKESLKSWISYSQDKILAKTE